jgi:serine/threonine-protein kinase
MAFFQRLKSVVAGGRRLDVRSRFELLREAISGTMSSFYMARDRQTGQIVGLKILDPQKTEAFESRFRGLNKPCEGEIGVRFLHPNIVRTLEYGVTTDGCQYLVMEYLDGPGLNSVLIARDGRLEGRRLVYLRQAAEAIAAVHRSGFIHRDICPRNLILAGDWGQIKLTDFGLSVPASPPFMREGNRTGTPNYMAPELVRRRPTDHRLDVFSFGVTAYELCTYELPWPAGATGLAAMTHDRPPRDILEYRPGLDRRLAKAIRHCIEPDLDQRCPNMPHFLKAVEGIEREWA